MFEDGTSVRQVTVGPGAQPRPDVVAGGRRDRVRARLRGRSRPLLGRRRRQRRAAAHDGPPRRRGARLGPDGRDRVRPRRRHLPQGARAPRPAAERRRGRRPRPRVVARRPPDRLHAPGRRARRRARASKRRRPARLRELWVMRANGSHAAAAEEAARRRLLPRLVAGRALDRVRDGPQRPARALHGARRPAARLRQVASRAADPRAIDWQPRGRDPVIAAAGDIACDPDLTRFATGLGTSAACHMLQTSDLLMKMDLSAVLAARRPPVRGRHPGQVPALLRPDLGPAEGADAPGGRQPRVPHPGRRAATSTTSTARRRRRPGRARATRATTPTTSAPWHVVDAQLPVLAPARPTTRTTPTARRARRRSSGCGPTSPPTRPRCTLALWHHPMVQLRSRRGVNDRPAALPGALRRRRRGAPDRPRPRLRALRADGRAQPTATPPAACASSSSARAARATTGSSFRQPNSEVRDDATFGVLKLTLRPERLPLGVRHGRRPGVVRRTRARTPATERARDASRHAARP